MIGCGTASDRAPPASGRRSASSRPPNSARNRSGPGEAPASSTSQASGAGRSMPRSCRHGPWPVIRDGGDAEGQSGERVTMFRYVGFPCHCERSEAISIPLCTPKQIARMSPGRLGSLRPRNDRRTELSAFPRLPGAKAVTTCQCGRAGDPGPGPPGSDLGQPAEVMRPAFRMAGALLGIGQAAVGHAQQRSVRLRSIRSISTRLDPGGTPRCRPSRSCRPGGAPAPPRGTSRGRSGRR